MLQVAGRQSRIKHKALLMAATPPTDVLSKPEFDSLPNQLPGDAFERMCSDPELMRAKRQFLGAVGAVVGLVVIATAVQLSGFWRIEHKPGDRVATAPPTAEVGVAVAPQSLAANQPSAESSNTVKKLSFRLSSSATDESTSTLEAQKVLVNFLAAKTLPEKLALVANPGSVQELMQAYYQKAPVAELAYERIESGGLPRTGYAEFRIILKDGRTKFAAVILTPEGPKLDWSSFALVGDLEWAQLLDQRPQTPVLMRVLARSAMHFEGHFKQSDGLRCVQLLPASDPTASPVFGYVPKGSELDKNLDYWLKSSGGEMLPLTLKICYSPESTTPDQAWITDLVTAGWVTLGVETPEGSE